MKIAQIKRNREEAKINYSAASKWYDLTEGLFEQYFRNLGIKLLDPNPNEKILEIGFGTGNALVKIAQQLDEGTIIGIDLAPGMFKECKQKVMKAGLKDKTKLFLKDALDFEYHKNYFDAIFMSFTLELFKLNEIEQLLFKLRTTLKEDGRLVIVSLHKPEIKSTSVQIYEKLHYLFPVLIDCRPIPVDYIIDKFGFKISKSRILSMWGIPVMIASATPY